MAIESFFTPGKASVVVGGQFGSEAKGLVAAYLARRAINAGIGDHRIVCTTNAGAQAGHTTILEDNRKFVCYHLPTIGVMLPESIIYINSGSIIDPDLLLREVIDVCVATGEDMRSMLNRICISPMAAVIHGFHKEEENEQTRHVASTMKGVGAALRDKIMRKPHAIAKTNKILTRDFRVEKYDLMAAMMFGSIVTVEIPQGTGLSLNASGFWPHTTSRDCWVGQGLTDAGIHPSFLCKTVMVQRTFPIRVGNVEGGHSGDFYPDGPELDWDMDFKEFEPERTTVTGRVRRIAEWSGQQYAVALRLNRPDFVFTTFTNYLREDLLYVLRDRMRHVEHTIKYHCCEHFWSWGPRVDQVTDNYRTIPLISFRSSMRWYTGG